MNDRAKSVIASVVLSLEGAGAWIFPPVFSRLCLTLLIMILIVGIAFDKDEDNKEEI